MEAIHLDCGRRTPQLKRNPLGGSPHSMKTQYLLAVTVALALLVPRLASAQDSTELGDGPGWEFADSNLVHNPPWVSATIPKNVVVLSFKDGTTAARRTAIIKQIHGTIVHFDRLINLYLIRVATHPDACGVKQAIDLLAHLPEVDMAVPDLAFTTLSDSIDPGSGLVDIPATHHGSNRPCPSGTGLLR